jgi:hypothetical protein
MISYPHIRLIPIADLVTHPAFQQRQDGLDKAHLKDLQEVRERGEKWKHPPVAFFDEARECYWLTGGFHRLEVAIQRQETEFEVEVRKGDFEAAQIWSWGENADHGLKRSYSDKRKAIRAALAYSDERGLSWTNREIGRYCRVNHETVEGVREFLRRSKEKLAEPPPETPHVPTTAIPPPDLRLAEEQGAEARETARLAPEAAHPDPLVGLVQGLFDTTKALSALGLLDRHRRLLSAVIADAWGEQQPKAPAQTRVDRIGAADMVHD